MTGMIAASGGAARRAGDRLLSQQRAAHHQTGALQAVTMSAARQSEETRLCALMASARAGDGAAYEMLLSALSARLRPFFANRLSFRPGDVEDLLQETLLAIHVRRETYDATLPLTAWTYAIARYKLIDHLRREGIRAHVPIDAVDNLFAPERTDAGDAARDVATLVAQLPEQQRTAIRLVKVEEKSVRDAALASGMSESSIKTNVHRGMKRLMNLIARSERS